METQFGAQKSPPLFQTACPHARDPKFACSPSEAVTLTADTFWDFGDLMQRVSLPLTCFRMPLASASPGSYCNLDLDGLRTDGSTAFLGSPQGQIATASPFDNIKALGNVGRAGRSHRVNSRAYAYCKSRFENEQVSVQIRGCAAKSIIGRTYWRCPFRGSEIIRTYYEHDSKAVLPTETNTRYNVPTSSVSPT
jgi:hypothetical protein